VLLLLVPRLFLGMHDLEAPPPYRPEFQVDTGQSLEPGRDFGNGFRTEKETGNRLSGSPGNLFNYRRKNNVIASGAKQSRFGDCFLAEQGTKWVAVVKAA
jgi:hypothetical protein